MTIHFSTLSPQISVDSYSSYPSGVIIPLANEDLDISRASTPY